jgi:hypothetical protein
VGKKKLIVGVIELRKRTFAVVQKYCSLTVDAWWSAVPQGKLRTGIDID